MSRSIGELTIGFDEIFAMAHALGLNAYATRFRHRKRSIPVDHYRNHYVFNGDGSEWEKMEQLGLLKRREMNQSVFPDSGVFNLTPKGIEVVESYILTAPRDRAEALRKIQFDLGEVEQ